MKNWPNMRSGKRCGKGVTGRVYDVGLNVKVQRIFMKRTKTFVTLPLAANGG